MANFAFSLNLLDRPLFGRPILLAGALVLLLGGCASSPPDNQANACAIFKEKGGWYKAMARAEKRYGLPIGTNLAIMRQESSFEANARPPRKRILGVIPGSRPSSAFGYAQATTPTWNDYRADTGRRGADRNDFSDAADFIGWYASEANDRVGISLNDPYRLYLAYHEGFGGYAQGSYRSKSWLQSTAGKVASNSRLYERQLAGCESSLNRRWLPFF